jgi:transcriptional regulator with XRE-family HTH domain
MDLTGHFVLFMMHFMLFGIGQQIRAERKRRKLSQDALARLLRMSRTTISQIENGTVQDIGVRKLIRILEVLGLELRVRSAGAPPTLDELREEES